MNAKLTLVLDERIVKQAKKFAKKKHQSVSKMVENYLRILTSSEPEHKLEPAPITKQLSGILKGRKEIDLKEEYPNYLIEKYK